MSAFEVLRAELAFLRQAGLPSWLESVSDAQPARYVTFTGGETREPTAGVVPNPDPNTGPWHVHCWLRGVPGAGYDLSPTHFRFSFSAAYPREPPDVHVLSTCHHALVDDDKEVSALFYHPSNLPPAKIGAADAATAGEERDEGKGTRASKESKRVEFAAYDLSGILTAARSFLSRPLVLSGDEDDAMRERLRESLRLAWTTAADENARRASSIDSFLRKRTKGGPRDVRWFDAAGWPRDFFDPDLLAVVDDVVRARRDVPELAMDRATGEKIRETLCRREAPGIYSFRMLTDAACEGLIAEIEHYVRESENARVPVRRPNSMNKYGVVVNEMGMERAIDALQNEILSPVAEALFPKQGGGALTSHHSFVVQYQEGKDLGLDLHTDDSDVTFNVCLGKTFTGAGLTFCGVLGAEVARGAAPHRKQTCAYSHEKGRAVVHLGAHRHGADDLETGERLNLILWNQSVAYRRSDAYRWRDVPEETEPPDAKCLSYTHDRDYGAYLPYPPGKEVLKKNAWYPPKEKDRIEMR